MVAWRQAVRTLIRPLCSSQDRESPLSSIAKNRDRIWRIGFGTQLGCYSIATGSVVPGDFRGAPDLVRVSNMGLFGGPIISRRGPALMADSRAVRLFCPGPHRARIA